MASVFRQIGMVVVALSVTACVNAEHKKIAKERDEIYGEWLPWWKGNCEEFNKQFYPWLKQNKDRAKKVEAAWDAIPVGDRDGLVKDLPDHQKLNRAEIEITIKCGMAPSRIVETEP